MSLPSRTISRIFDKPLAERVAAFEELKAGGERLRQEQQKALNSTPITSYQQALAYYNSSDIAKLMPISKEISNLNWSINYANAVGKDPNSIGYVREDIAKAEAIRANPLNYIKQNFPRIVSLASFPDFPELANNYKSDLDRAVSFLIESKVPATEIKTLVDKGMAEANQRYQHNVSASKPGLMDYVFGAAENLIVGGLTGGIGLSAVNSAALSSALAIANGAKPEDAIRAGLGSVVANQVPEYLKSVNALIPNDAAYAGVVNAERQATYALLTKQDPKQAALAGLAGGATAGYLASDNAAIGRATGEYIQALAAGRSQTDAMMAALGGFAQEEYAEAQKKILAEKQARDEGKTTVGATKTTPTTPPSGAAVGGEAVGTAKPTGGADTLPEVTVTGTKPSSTVGTDLSFSRPTQIGTTTTQTLPSVTVTGTPNNASSSNLSFQSTTTLTPEKEPIKQKTPEERAKDVMLLGLLQPSTIFGPTGTGGMRRDPTTTSSTVGSQALAQALRVGDLGAPIFGRKEEGRRAGWNVESLRYMGNSEA